MSVKVWHQLAFLNHCHWDSCGCVSTILSCRFSPLWSPSSTFSGGFFSSLVSSSLFRLSFPVPVFIWHPNGVLCFPCLAFASTKYFSSFFIGPLSEKKESRYACAYWSEVIRSRLMEVPLAEVSPKTFLPMKISWFLSNASWQHHKCASFKEHFWFTYGTL